MTRDVQTYDTSPLQTILRQPYNIPLVAQKLHSFEESTLIKQTTNKLRGLSPRANYTDRAMTACWRS
jgi:hypothetical protein